MYMFYNVYKKSKQPTNSNKWATRFNNNNAALINANYEQRLKINQSKSTRGFFYNVDITTKTIIIIMRNHSLLLFQIRSRVLKVEHGVVKYKL